MFSRVDDTVINLNQVQMTEKRPAASGNGCDVYVRLKDGFDFKVVGTTSESFETFVSELESLDDPVGSGSG